MPILEMKVPSPGESISEVEIAAWLVSDGDYVEKDQAIAEVDSDKATLELPAEAAGIITLKSEEGDVVDVGGVVCLIDTAAEKPVGFDSAVEEAPVIEEEVKVEVKPDPMPVAKKDSPAKETYAAGHPSVAAKKLADANKIFETNIETKYQYTQYVGKITADCRNSHFSLYIIRT